MGQRLPSLASMILVGSPVWSGHPRALGWGRRRARNGHTQANAAARLLVRNAKASLGFGRSGAGL